MPLEPGTRLGPYEITGDLGKGGMGEVYRARDTKLNRDVAVKVLPEAFLSDPERLERFEREAQVLASLNHPNIAHVYGFEHADGVQAIAMELVEGPTLADRLAGGALPMDDALPIARQIADALVAAHEAGVIHRDLKPANIKVRDDGTVKVLDFGLAKAFAPEGEASSIEESPTLTARATQMGVILGTAAYMAPEQAKGRAVDKRADVWAFGVVLYEMLTGQRLFAGEDVSDTLAAVLRAEPEWSALPDDTPPPIRRLLRRALERKRQNRLADMADARAEIADVEAGVADGEAAAAAPAAAPPPSTWQRLRPWVAGAVAVGVTALATWFFSSSGGAPEVVRRFAIPLPPDSSFTNTNNRVLAVSPDGMYVAIGSQEQLLLRRADEIEATPLRGTTEARTPFFSPDSQELGFWADGQIKRVAVTGGSPVVVGSSPGRPFGASWGDDGFIYVGRGTEGIARLPETGGQPEIVVQAEGRYLHGPQLLAGGDWVLYTSAPGQRQWDRAEIVAGSLTSDDRVVLVDGGHDARALPTGHLLYVLDGVLFGQRFDVDRREVLGGPVSILEGVRTSNASSTGSANYDITDDGTLVYVSGASTDLSRLAWVDRSGQNEEMLPLEAQEFVEPIGFALSPDQTQIVAEVSDDPNQLWLFEVDRPGGRRLTLDGGEYPAWSADGEWVYFAVAAEEGPDIWRKRADLSGEAELLYGATGEQRPYAESHDGNYLYFTENPDASGDRGLGRLSLEGDPQPEMLIEGKGGEGGASPSPDGRFLAYNVDETGEHEVYMMELATGRRWLISTETGPGYLATWTDSSEIVYWSGADKMMSVAVTTDPAFTHAAPQLLHERPAQFFPYAITRDGQRFIHTVPSGSDGAVDGVAASSPRVLVVQNWFEELKRLVPVGGR